MKRLKTVVVLGVLGAASMLAQAPPDCGSSCPDTGSFFATMLAFAKVFADVLAAPWNWL